jgi:hypothetical protein
MAFTGVFKKHLSVFTTGRFHAKQESEGTFKELQLCGTGRNAKEEQKTNLRSCRFFG